MEALSTHISNEIIFISNKITLKLKSKNTYHKYRNNIKGVKQHFKNII